MKYNFKCFVQRNVFINTKHKTSVIGNKCVETAALSDIKTNLKLSNTFGDLHCCLGA